MRVEKTARQRAQEKAAAEAAEAAASASPNDTTLAAAAQLAAQLAADAYRRNKNGDYLLPILPLNPSGKLDQEDLRPDWQAARLLPSRVQDISGWLLTRFTRLSESLQHDLPTGSWKTWLLGRAYRLFRGSLARDAHERVMEVVQKQLKKGNLWPSGARPK